MAQPRVTGLSGNEVFCMKLRGFSPSGLVVGNSVQSMGLIGSLGSAFRGVLGGEVPSITSMIHDGRASAFERMRQEARREGLHGIVGVSSELRSLAGNSEFLCVGSGVISESACTGFSSAGDAQELYCHMDAGYVPVEFVFGNIAYAVGAVRGLTGFLKTLVRGEIKEFSDVFNATRHDALARLTAQAKAAGANSVVGIRTTVMRFGGVHEMFMTGTAANHPALADTPETVSSDLTGEELWALSHLGYVPVKLLMSTAVYSLGALGGLKAAFKGLVKGEISELTSLIYDAREHVFDRLQSEAEAAGAEEVVGVKTYIIELGGGLVELVAIGTAVRKHSGAGVASDALPAQAIIRDRDTWLSGEGGLDLVTLRAGG